MNDINFLSILLADDDQDDCLFFKDALAEMPLTTSLTIVNDGEQLMQHLETNTENLPDVVFLDLNMPRKNGFECLNEIKNHSILKILPIIMYSTSFEEEKAELLYKTGAQYFICKPSDFEELKDVIYRAIILVKQNGEQTTNEKFLVNQPNIIF